MGYIFSFSAPSAIKSRLEEIECKKKRLAREYSELTEKLSNANEYIESLFVDLGLPSGTMWAKTNIGTSHETDCGLYFQWGSTVGYDSFDAREKHSEWKGVPGYETDYDGHAIKFELSSWYWTYVKDNGGFLDTRADGAYVNTDGIEIMPTAKQYAELYAETNHEFIKNYKNSGVNGMKFVNKKDSSKYIFIPATCAISYGKYRRNFDMYDNLYGKNWYDSNCVFTWTSCGDTTYTNAYLFLCCDTGYVIGSCERCVSIPIRGVKCQTDEEIKERLKQRAEECNETSVPVVESKSINEVSNTTVEKSNETSVPVVENRSYSICPVCGKKFPKSHGKIYCSKACRESNKHYPTKKEVLEKYEKLRSWTKVAEWFNLTRKIIQGIRKQ